MNLRFASRLLLASASIIAFEASLLPSSGDTVSSLVIVSNETAVSSWTVERGGELRLGADVADPLVRWTFDDAAQV